jgi:hypothetical protein
MNMKLQRAVLLLSLSVLLPGPLLPQTVDSRFGLTISVPQTILEPGSEVRVQIALTNLSGHDVVVPRMLSTYAANYDIEVRDANGKLAPDSAYSRWVKQPGDAHHIRIQGGSVSQETIKPAGSLKEEALITRFFDITKPGEYVIQVSREDLGGGTLKSNAIKITVVG